MDPLIIILRLIIPLSIFPAPLWGGLASMFLDGIDWSVNLFHIANLHATYLFWDKLLDLYYYIIEGIVVFRWRNLLSRNTALALFLIRAFGNVSFLVTGNEYLLFIFPNVFENFFLFYYAVWAILGHEPKLSKLTLRVSLFVLTIPKLFQEYVMHVELVTNWRYIKIPFFNLTYDNILSQILIGAALVFFVSYLQTRKRRGRFLHAHHRVQPS